VEIAGVRIGRVEGIGLADDKARLTLRLSDGIKLPGRCHRVGPSPGSDWRQICLGLPRCSDKIIPPGGKIRETDSPPDIPDLIGKIVGGDLTSSKGEKKDESSK
jgi:hypothetical protein